MTTKGKVTLAISLSAAVMLLSAAAVGTIMCKKIYEKKYFSAN